MKKNSKKINLKKIFNKKQIFVLTLIFCLAGAGIFIYKDYQAKGATYGWVQSGWGGGSSESVRTHSAETADPEGWSNYSSANNVIVSDDQVTMSSEATSVTDTSTTQFNAGSWEGDNPCIVMTNSGDQMTGSSACYNASTYGCDNFYVLPTDMDGAAANWTTAMSYCDSLCPTCDLPTLTELQCIYTNRASFGNNFVTSGYWSATEYLGSLAYGVNFSSGSTYYNIKTYGGYYVRCIYR